MGEVICLVNGQSGNLETVSLSGRTPKSKESLKTCWVSLWKVHSGRCLVSLYPRFIPLFIPADVTRDAGEAGHLAAAGKCKKWPRWENSCWGTGCKWCMRFFFLLSCMFRESRCFLNVAKAYVQKTVIFPPWGDAYFHTGPTPFYLWSILRPLNWGSPHSL